MRQLQCVPTTYVSENKETYFEIFTNQESCTLIRFVSLKHLTLPISIKIPATVWQIVYIYLTAISPNYAFAKLVVAWLY